MFLIVKISGLHVKPFVDLNEKGERQISIGNQVSTSFSAIVYKSASQNLWPFLMPSSKLEVADFYGKIVPNIGG